MKEILLKIALSLRFLKPLIRVILAKNEDKIIDLINEKYDKKGMTEEEERAVIKEIFDKIIKLV